MKAHHAKQVEMLSSYLDRHDDLLKASRAEYALYHAKEIEELPFQTALVNQALEAKRLWTAELATGVGKTIVAARIAASRSSDGPVIYVCPGTAALGDLNSGIINKVSRTFTTFGKPTAEMGQLNDLSAANDVSFMTPWALAHHLRHDYKRTSELFKRASCFIVDEAHHFPNDENDELRIYGSIFDAADRLVNDGLTVAMTGTWERLDRLQVMGCAKPHARLSVQDAVDLKRCPEIYGIQVITEVVAKKATARGDLYDLHLSAKERLRYLDGVAHCMLTTYQRCPVPFAAFVRTQADAAELARRFNAISKLGEERGLAVLTAQTSLAARMRAIKAIIAGQCVGYVTCAVGEEALDLPALEVVHLVRRTRSHVRNMQAVGRALRVHQGKKRALVVDYQTLLDGAHERFLGISLDDLGDRQGTRTTTRVNGGPITVQPNFPEAVLCGMTMQEERALVCVQSPKQVTSRKAELLARASAGSPKPNDSRGQPRDEQLLAHALYNYTHGVTADLTFIEKIRAIRPDWLANRNDSVARKAELLRRAAAGEDKPKRLSTDNQLAVALYNYCYPKSMAYDAHFVSRLRKIRPDWLEPQRLRNQERIESNKATLRKLALTEESRPQGRMGVLLANYAIRATHPTYDAAFAKEMRKLRPLWFKESSAIKKQALLERARSGEKPQFRSLDPFETSLAHMLSRYVTPEHRCYDAAFVRELQALQPSWVPSTSSAKGRRRFSRKRAW